VTCAAAHVSLSIEALAKSFLCTPPNCKTNQRINLRVDSQTKIRVHARNSRKTVSSFPSLSLSDSLKSEIFEFDFLIRVHSCPLVVKLPPPSLRFPLRPLTCPREAFGQK
jgi:hypothetical protein